MYSILQEILYYLKNTQLLKFNKSINFIFFEQYFLLKHFKKAIILIINICNSIANIVVFESIYKIFN